MKYCTNCGVELDPDMDHCPLCHDVASEKDGLIPPKQEHQKATFTPQKESKKRNEPEKRHNRKLFWELSVLVLFSAIVITFLIDFFTSKQLTWSKYPIVVCLFLLVNSSLLSFLRHQAKIITIGSFLSIVALILIFDYFGKHMGWSYKLGIPFLILLYLYIFSTILLIKFLKERGINIIAFLLSMASLICLAVETLLDTYIDHEISLGWSLYALSSSVPISGILLFVHYRMKKGRELKRLFHL